MRPIALACLLVATLAGAAAAQDMPTMHDDRESDAAYRFHSAALSAGTLATIVVNASNHSPGWVGAAGFLGGTAQVIYATRIRDTHATTSSFNYVVGGAAILTSLSALARGGGATQAEATNAIHVMPLLAWDGERNPLAGAVIRF